MAGLQDTSSSTPVSPEQATRLPLLTLSQTEQGSSATLRGQTGRKEAHWLRHPLCIHAQSRHQHPSFPAHPGHGGHRDPRGRPWGSRRRWPYSGWIPPSSLSSSTPGSALDPYSSCNKNCECQTDSFTPVCGQTASPTCLPALWLQQHGIADFLTGWDGAGSSQPE